MTTAPGKYVLSNRHAGAPGMHHCLSDILDPNTTDLLRDYLSVLEIGPMPAGSRALVLGAGIGTTAMWFANEISLGAITALDMDTSRVLPEVRDHDRIDVVTRDLLTDPVPDGHWDLVHARLLFAHLSERRRILKDVVDRLAPGGTVMIEDWGVAGTGRILDAPNPRTKYLFQKYQRALISVFSAAGNDPDWSVEIHAEMTILGLHDVRTHSRARSWRGGEPGCELPIAVSIELEDPLVRHGMTYEDLEQLRSDLADPQVVVVGNQTWSTLGRRRSEG